MRRQGATCNGLKKRVRDLGFDRVEDPRVAGKVEYSLPTVLTALVAAMVTMARSLRMVEQRTGQMARKQGRWMGVQGRIADNTFGKVLPRLEESDLMACLHRLVKAEHRRGNLKATRLPRGAVAIDGKNVATLHWHDMLRVLELKPDETTVEQGTALFAQRYPLAQVCTRDIGEPYALIRVHTVTLISSEAGWLDWTHARQLVRVQRTTEDQRTGEVTVGNRYYVTSRSTDALGPSTALKTCRAHWRCENNTHWILSLQVPRARGQRQLRLRRARDAPAGRAAGGRRWRGRLSDRT